MKENEDWCALVDYSQGSDCCFPVERIANTVDIELCRKSSDSEESQSQSDNKPDTAAKTLLYSRRMDRRHRGPSSWSTHHRPTTSSHNESVGMGGARLARLRAGRPRFKTEPSTWRTPEATATRVGGLRERLMHGSIANTRRETEK